MSCDRYTPERSNCTNVFSACPETNASLIFRENLEIAPPPAICLFRGTTGEQGDS